MIKMNSSDEDMKSWTHNVVAKFEHKIVCIFKVRLLFLLNNYTFEGTKYRFF